MAQEGIPVGHEAIPVGIEALERIDDLPYLMPGVRSYMFSSHDRTGGNDDGFNGTYSFLYKDETGYVLFDAYGPGCLYRIWSANPGKDLKFYFDEEESPRIEISQKDLFSGRVSPFIFPLAGDMIRSSGGYYSYLPIPFEKRLKISSSSSWYFYQFSYALYPHDTGVKTYTGQEDISGVLSQWMNPGKDPKRGRGNIVSEGNVSIGPGEVKVILEQASAGSISSIRLKPSTDDRATLRKVFLRIYWDGDSFANVSAPFWDFFGAGARSLLLGQDEDGWLYSYFPMPFNSSARIELENGNPSGISIAYEIRRGGAYSKDAGQFHALWSEKNPTELGKDFIDMEARGRGKFIGISASMQGVDPDIRTQCGSPYICFLEGDERVYVDGSLSPDIHGTGTEDYFNGGWYFIMGTFSLPLHGNPSRPIDGLMQINAYRIHLGDSVPFESSLKFGREVGAANNITARYSSVAYSYLKGDKWLVLTDELDVGDGSSEAQHSYSAEGSAVTEITSSYEGAEGSLITDSGRRIQEQSSFVLYVNAGNKGARLRVRKDMGEGIQKARVFINGNLIGTWYLPELNPFKRWRDADIEIPEGYIRGKDSITISVKNYDTEGWNEYHYWIYSRLDNSSD